MKVLYLNHNRAHEGTFYRCFFLARELVKLGHDLTIITVSNTTSQCTVKRKNRDGVKIITLPFGFRKRNLLFSVLRPFLSMYCVLTRQYDLIHAFAVAKATTAFPLRAFSFLKDRRQLLIDWDDLHSDASAIRLRPYRWLATPLIKYLELRTPMHASTTTVVSGFLHDRATRLGLAGNDVIHVPNGCDTDAITPLDKMACRKALGLPKGGNILVYMGNTHPSFSGLYNSFVKAAPEDTVLLCLGRFDGAFDGAFTERDNIIFPGYAIHEDLSRYLGAADVLLLPMKDNGYENSRWPIRFADYLCSGRPVVSTGIGEVGKIIRKYECGVVANSIDDMLAVSIDLLTDVNRTLQLGVNARKAAEELSWIRAARQMDEIYRQRDGVLR